MRSSAYTHKQAILSQLPKLITINAALKVDLTGQMYFVRVGARSQAGHAFIALPATAKGGKIRRITMPRSGPVTTARSEADVIVTEFGAAELKGRSIGERARRLVAIAHPDFREDLDRAAHALAQRGF
jgi:acyl-CoA hydrolase